MAYPNIEAERARAGLTRTELASEMGVSLPTYNKYISATTPIPSDKLLYLRQRFSVSIDYLLGLQNPPVI